MIICIFYHQPLGGRYYVDGFVVFLNYLFCIECDQSEFPAIEFLGALHQAIDFTLARFLGGYLVAHLY